ncbi:MAG: hypothetical protein JWN08_2561 [Frankiales bacterium]|nr:hypothetical protein [Frankiales bacterium]
MPEQRSWSRPAYAPAPSTSGHDLATSTDDPEGTSSMTSPCTARRGASTLTKTGALAVVFGLALAPTVAAYAQDSVPSTVRALIGGDGSVSSVERLGGVGEATAADLPVTVAISQSEAGDATTTNYRVENTTVTKKQVSYLDPEGKSATVEQDVALPLVAQLAVRLPSSRTDVQALGARITKLSDGSTELVWSMVLFNPIGAPVSDVSFTAGGSGEPLARIDVAAVQPNATPGLSGTGQAANAIVNGNGILSTVANGANEGLLKLSAGVGQLLAGLDKLEAGAVQLNEGIAAGADGAAQLAAGSATAKDGSAALASGLGQLKTGTADLSTGAGKLDVGAQSLADGLGLIAAGLDQLSAANALPAALDGAKKLRFGVSHAAGTLGATDPGGLLEVLGSPTNPATILGGLVALRGGIGGVTETQGAIDPTNPALSAVGGLELIKRGLTSGLDPANPAGLFALKGGADQVAAGAPGIATLLTGACSIVAVTPDLAATPTVSLLKAGCADTVGAKLNAFVGGTKAVAAGVGSVVTSSQQSLAGVSKIQTGLLGASAGLDKLVAGVTAVRAGVSSGSAEKPGIVEGLDALVAGLTSAVGGVDQLATGARSAATGSGALAEGADMLNAGSKLLAAGAGTAAAGAGALDAGIGKIADGQQKVADGLPAAVDGSGQIADGLGSVIEGETAVEKGLGDVRSQAIAVLSSQFTQGTTIARQQLAGLDAAAELINSTPGAATTTWVLTQSQRDISATLASSSSDDSSTGRNVALGAGGALLLLGGIAGGFLSGRRATGA